MGALVAGVDVDAATGVGAGDTRVDGGGGTDGLGGIDGWMVFFIVCG